MTDLERAQALYESAVNGRREFRAAYRSQLARTCRLEAVLREVRTKAIPAGGSVVRQNDDWQERVCEVLDLIDDALEAKDTAEETP